MRRSVRGWPDRPFVAGQLSGHGYCRWRKECGGLDLGWVQRVNHLEKERRLLKQRVSDLSPEAGSQGHRFETLVSSEQRRQEVAGTRGRYRLWERQACRIAGQLHEPQRYMAMVRADEGALTWAIMALAVQYGRYGYR